MKIQEFTLDYIRRLKLLLDKIDVDVVEEIFDTLTKTIEKKSKIYIIGNGGSSSVASHMVNDLGCGLRRREIISLDIMSLADNTPVCTAISNDLGYENIFYMQLKDILRKDDVLIAISSSGNSANIIKSAAYAGEIGAVIIGCTGFDGGKLKKMADISFHIETPRGEYGLVEDVHGLLSHLLHSYFLKR
jgi:D-sedoheptulose 7-phosphate isomerase